MLFVNSDPKVQFRQNVNILFVFCLFLQSADWLWSDGSAFDPENWAEIEPSIWNRWKKCLAVNQPGTVIKSTNSRQEILK